ncbi:phosphotyrosine protein phosphatase [Actinoplanes oblitus]|uniref:protein-tyrosine-phosphatase n=1 Tax=Actinoplanes oblitus TaxID=3040509 RepID=A0ABY8WUM6_9ACTN|nr:phosphotyrosine protein phosphatase [Actinoplanes oblitus]WIN00954.1 phosphotyrosine protein phosphatase [Actinoplanes oblitus]
MGNICRSPMAERLLARAVRDRSGSGAEQLVRSVSAGTGGWHEGEEMNPPAARLVRARRGSDDGFLARKLRGDFIDEADLILTATADQYDYVVALRPAAAERTFVLGEFGRLLGAVDKATLPPAEPEPEAVRQRGTALVAAVHRLRAGETPLLTDDLDDPWGRGDQTFQRVADEIEDATMPLAALLLP